MPERNWIATAEESRELDMRAESEFGISVRTLMEEAGGAVFEVVKEMVPARAQVVFFCGKGNNGGDGFVAARLAKAREFRVICLVASTRDSLSPLAAEQCNKAEASGVAPIFVDDPRYFANVERLSEAGLIVDALLGTGIQGPAQGAIEHAILGIRSAHAPVLAVDIPSGIECDTGIGQGAFVVAGRTVTFGTAKPYLFQNDGVMASGHWTVAEIGFPAELVEIPRMAQVLEKSVVAQGLPRRAKDSHKGANGSVLVVAGSRDMPGAALLAAKAAYRAGAGLVTVASTTDVCRTVAAQLPEAIFLTLPEDQGAISPAGAETIIESSERCAAAIFGPGLSQSLSIQELLSLVWKEWSRPCVIDADALNAVSGGVALPDCPCVLTPHPGELARLLQTTSAAVQRERFRFVREASEKLGKTVLLKGAFSLLCDTDAPILVNPTGNSGMAVAGMGDVLCGVIGALLAQGLSPAQAGACGMYWHGLAGDICADTIGTIGFKAGELADALPKARATITAT